MSKFTKIPAQWTNQGIEPPLSKKNSGWAVDERPPAEYLNWLFAKTYEALNEIQNDAVHKTEQVAERKRQYARIRKNNKVSALQQYVYPTTFALRYGAPPIVFTDYKGGFTTNFDMADFKNVGGKIIYANTLTGSSTNDGLSREKPCQSLEKALVLANDGDTIIITNPEGSIIDRSGWAIDGYIKKSVNIIAENNVVSFKGDTPTWVKSSGYTSVYEITRSAVIKIIDMNNIDVPITYKKVASITEVENNPFSWYTDNTKTYINCGANKVPNDKILPLLQSGRSMLQNVSTQNCKIYLENLTLVGGDRNIWIVGDANYNQHEIYTKNCKCYFATSGDAILTQNAKRSYHQKTIAAYSAKDGFNYSTTIGGSNIVDFIEIDCKGIANGDNAINTPNTHNGSTAHAKSYGVRINCTYYDNVGGNLIDVQGVRSVNLGCVTFDSRSEDILYNQGMGTQGDQGVANTEQWFEGCVSFGNKSDFYCPTNQTVHVKLCQYDTIDGGGIKDLDERL